MYKLCFILLLSLCSCATDSTQTPTVTPPVTWPITIADAPSAERHPVLQALITEALYANTDLLLATTRISQARAGLTIQSAGQFPSLSAQARAARTRTSPATLMPGMPNPSNVFSLGAVLSYEVDLWGRVRQGVKAAQSELYAAESIQDALRLSLTAEVTFAYVQLQTLREQAMIAADSIQALASIVRILADQTTLNNTDPVNLYEAQSQLANAQAQQAMLHSSLTQQQHALCILLGRSVDSLDTQPFQAVQLAELLTTAPQLPELPSDLLERRPDIAAAAHILEANHAQLKAAKTAYFPSLSLSGLLGLTHTQVGSLFHSEANTWQLAGTAAMPILDFNRTQGTVAQAKASQTAALIRYQEAIRVAFQETWDALTQYQGTLEALHFHETSLNALYQAAHMLDARSQIGHTQPINALQAQVQLFAAQGQYIVAQRDHILAITQLEKAIGGPATHAPAHP